MVDRRSFIRLAAGTGIAGLFGLASARQPAEEKPVSRFLFLTDIHLPAEGKNDQARKSIEDLVAKYGKHDFTVLGGDNVMGSDTDFASASHPQWANWLNFSRNNMVREQYTVLGNHDIWGWNSHTQGVGLEQKETSVKLLGMPGRYYTFERAGWRFIMLDSVQPDHRLGYIGHIDDEQIRWLKKVLNQDTKATVVVSHIPILSAGDLACDASVQSDLATKVSHQRMISNSHHILEIFRAHPNVRLCLSGHLHTVDSVRYRHTKFLCGGAICGGWWKGEQQHFGRIGWSVDLFATGRAKAMPLEFDQKRVLVS